MSVLECANKLLQILALNDLPPKLRWSENGDLKFSDSKEGEERQQETTEHWDNIALLIALRGIHFTPWKAHIGAFPPMDQSLRTVTSARTRTHRVWINKMAAEIMLNMIFNTHFKIMIKKDNKEKEWKKNRNNKLGAFTLP